MAKSAIVIALIFSLCSAIKVSSKIDLDSNEECSDRSPPDFHDVIIVIDNKSDVTKETKIRPSGSKSFSGGNFNFRNSAIPARRSKNNNPPSSQSKAIKKIYILVNGKDVTPSIPDSVNCKDNICETTVTMNPNGDDNEIVSVDVKVFTKPNSPKIEDIPVIDGLRASGYEFNYISPTLVPKNERVLPHHHFFDNNIPQGQLPRRYTPRQHSASLYPRNFGPRRESTAWNPWIPSGGPIDDKIEPPLSKTDHVAQ